MGISPSSIVAGNNDAATATTGSSGLPCGDATVVQMIVRHACLRWGPARKALLPLSPPDVSCLMVPWKEWSLWAKRATQGINANVNIVQGLGSKQALA